MTLGANDIGNTFLRRIWTTYGLYNACPDDLDIRGRCGVAPVPKTVLKAAVRTMLVSVAGTAAIGGQPLRDTELLTWCGEVIRSVLADL